MAGLPLAVRYPQQVTQCLLEGEGVDADAAAARCVISRRAPSALVFRGSSANSARQDPRLARSTGAPQQKTPQQKTPQQETADWLSAASAATCRREPAAVNLPREPLAAGAVEDAPFVLWVGAPQQKTFLCSCRAGSLLARPCGQEARLYSWRDVAILTLVETLV